MSEIIGDYKKYVGEQLFQPKSTFTLKGFEFEFKKWDIERENNPIDKLMFNLWMVEPSPFHPAVMGKIEVYDGISSVYVNPFFDDVERERITLELKKAASQHFLGK
jgi:hypothetical protein